MDKLLKLRSFLSSQGFVNVDAIIASCASSMLAEKARKDAEGIMDTWTVDELKAAASVQNTRPNDAKRNENKGYRR